VTWDELAGKFRDCAGRVLNAGAVDRLVELVRNLRHLPDLRELSGLLAGAPEPVKEAAR
jgi:hypothetical protein